MSGSAQPYVLHSAEGHPVSQSGGPDTGEFESPITHPWRKYCTTRWEFLPRFILPLIFAFILLIIVLVLDSKLKVVPGIAYQRTAVSGYSSLEQAGSATRVTAILKAWSGTQRSVAAFSCGIHFLFLFLYTTVMTMLCCWGANHSPYKTVGDFLAWLQLFGAFCDVVLQSSLAYMIVNGATTGLPELTLAMVILHLLVLCLGGLYFVIARIGHWVVWRDISRRGPLDDKVY